MAKTASCNMIDQVLCVYRQSIRFTAYKGHILQQLSLLQSDLVGESPGPVNSYLAF